MPVAGPRPIQLGCCSTATPLNNCEARVSEWEALSGLGRTGLPLATIIPTSARWLPYHSPVRAKSVGSIAQPSEFGSGILVSILREQRGGGTGHNAWWVSVAGASAPHHQHRFSAESADG